MTKTLSRLLLILISQPFAYCFRPQITKVVASKYQDGWLEGPVFKKNGELYVMSPKPEASPERGGVLKVDLEKNAVSVFVEPKINNYHSMPNGADADQEGNLWVTDLRLGLLKITPDGEVRQMMTHDSSNEPIQGFNDVAIDYTGNMWITAPVGIIAPAPYKDGFIDSVNGSIYSYIVKNKKLTKLDTGFQYSNGIAVQHSANGTPEVLFVTEFVTRKLWAYNITGPGQIDLVTKRVWGSRPGGVGGFDGIDFDDEGNLLVCNNDEGSVEVFGPQGGAPIDRIELPGITKITNLEFKPGTNKVYVTNEDAGNVGLFKFSWRVKGQKKFRDLGPVINQELAPPIITRSGRHVKPLDRLDL